MSNPFEPATEVASKSAPQESNFFQDAYDLCAKHPLETIGAGVGIAVATALAIRNPMVMAKLEALELRAAALCRNPFAGGRPLTAAERWHFWPEPQWIKQADGTSTALHAGGTITKCLDGTLKHEIKGWKTTTMHNDRRIIDEYVNGFTQTRNLEYVNKDFPHLSHHYTENHFPDGRKLTVPSSGYFNFKHSNGTELEMANEGSVWTIRKADGSFLRQDGCGAKSMRWANHDALYINADGSRELHLDHNLYWAKPNSTEWKRRTDGVVTAVDEATSTKLQPWLTADPVSQEFKKILGELFHF